MKNIPEKIIRLKFQSLYRDLNDTESRELRNWVSNNPNDYEELNKLAELFKDYLLVENYRSIDRKRAWTIIKEKTINLNKKQKRIINFNLIRTVAAAFIVLIAVSIYLIINAPSTELYGKIKPGSSKALMELSDGEKILLEDTTSFVVRNKQGVILGIKESDFFVFNSLPDQVEVKNTSVPRAITVPYGGEYTIQLPDKSIIILNSGSTLKFLEQDNYKVRRVELEGEAWFDIAENRQVPFEVVTQHSVVSVLGTKFNICSYPDDTEQQITLVEGSIEVKNKKQTLLMSPGEQFISSTISNQSTLLLVDTNLYTSWKDGIFRFQDMQLEAIMPKFERWYNVKFLFEDEECASLRFTGATERKTNFAEFVKLIESTSKVRFTLKDNKIIISRK